jgi:excisionase family DNA binding protein
MTATMTTPVQLLTATKTAEALAVSARQVDRLVDAGVLRPVRLTEGGHRRFRLTDIAQLVANRQLQED